MGSKRPRKREEPKVEIPHKVDPFDRTKLHHKPLSGEKLFGASPAEGVWGDARWQQQCGEQETPWCGPVDEQLAELTHGFEDDFVDVWSDLCQGTATSALLDADQTIFSYGLEKEDPVFKTIPGECQYVFLLRLILFYCEYRLKFWTQMDLITLTE